MARIEGVDISHWNNTTKWIELNPEFVIIKATEGNTYVDNMCKSNCEYAKAIDAERGYYHYARAEKNNAKAEAEHFVRNIPDGEIGSAILALDYEGKALSLKNCDSWALEFLKHVEALTGVKPLLYCSQSVVKRFPEVAKNGNGLWVARYRNKMLGAGDIKPWKFSAIWQYDSTGTDKNIFYGNRKQFRKYAEVKRNE